MGAWHHQSLSHCYLCLDCRTGIFTVPPALSASGPLSRNWPFTNSWHKSAHITSLLKNSCMVPQQLLSPDTGPHLTQLLTPLRPHHLTLRPPDRTENTASPLSGPGMTGVMGRVISLCVPWLTGVSGSHKHIAFYLLEMAASFPLGESPHSC